jgi:hypothetical protein
MTQNFNPFVMWFKSAAAMNAAAADMALRMMETQAELFAVPDRANGRDIETITAENMQAAAHGYATVVRAAPFLWMARSPGAGLDIMAGITQAAAADPRNHHPDA